MRSLRRLNLLLIALVLLPTGVLAALSLQASAAYREEVAGRLRRELRESESTFRGMLGGLLNDDQERGRDLARAIADETVRRLPFEPASRVFGEVLRPPVVGPLEGFPAWVEVAWAPARLELSIQDAAGVTLFPAAHRPDAPLPPGAERQRLLEALRSESDAALFGRGDVIAAQAVWTAARARFTTDDLKALADVEHAWVMARGPVNPPALGATFARLRHDWPEETLDGLGRPWVLLLLAIASANAPELGDHGVAALEGLARLRKSGRLEEIPLTEQERVRIRALLEADSSLPAKTSQDTFTAPLPAGLTLVLRRTLPPDREAVTLLLQAVNQEFPTNFVKPLAQIQFPEGALEAVWKDEARLVEVRLPSGGGNLVFLQHPEAAGLEQMLAARRRWTYAGIGALVVLVAVGLYLSTRAIAREREARRLKDDFLANVSHELRTPLTAVCLHADLLAEPALPEDRRRAHAEVVRAEGARLAAMVDDLLDFAALERGARRLEIEPVDLGAALQRAVEPFRVLAEREGVDLRVEVEGGEATALADPHALARILANLVGNAWKHGRPSRDGAPGRIRLGVADRRVTVQDDGPGIPAAERAHLFERFRRGAAAARTRGVGLGLALSRDLARAMGGDLVVVEDPEATVFRLTLRRVDDFLPMPPYTPVPEDTGA